MKLYTSSKKIKNVNSFDINVAIYGLGKMGLPLAVVFANQGFKVTGVDINKTNVDKINKGINPIVGEEGLDKMLGTVIESKNLYATTDGVAASKNSDVKIIIVPIFINDNNSPDMSSLFEVVKKIGEGINKGDIVILESTAPPGTTQEVAKRIEKISKLRLNKDFSVAHCPERTSSGTAISDIMGRLDPKIVGGSDEKTTEIAKFIYEKINKRGVIPVSTTKVAELVKIYEGVYRDVNIAFANNLYLLCRELNVDALEVIKACNTDVYSHILQPGPGVGGHCIPVYPYFILKNVKENKDLVTLARNINDKMSTHTINLVEEALAEKNKSLKDSSILILGFSYRSGVKEIRKSPGLKIAKELKQKVKRLYLYDSLFNEKETNKLGFTYKKDFEGIDCLIITTKENQFKKLNWENIAKTLSTKAVVDTQDIINYEKMEELGFSIRRIGYAK